ncbi:MULTISPECIES: helix-turn-helix domain-containing protein, partial [Acetobacter]|uniref:helix-turn-helix domain-containing protein n=1 Tax=Acetobacter TaxID=434 RepID=UPI00054DECD2
MSLKAILKERGITQAQLASQMGVSEPTVSRWISGKALIPTQMLRAVSQALDVSLEKLVPEKSTGVAA